MAVKSTMSLKRITSKDEPEILIASAAVGAGHETVARTLINSLNKRAPNIRVRTCDVLSYTTAWFRAYYAGGFALTMSRFPYFYGLLYHLSNHPQGTRRSLFEQRRIWTERKLLRGFTRRLIKSPPTLIVNTHFLSPPIVEHARNSGWIDTPQMVIVTDFEMHRFWYCGGVERWFVPSDYSANTLWRWGVKRPQITVSGIPVRPQWTLPAKKTRILKEWGLSENEHLVILTGGAQFTCGPIYKIAQGILKTCPGTNLVALAGSNKILFSRLKRLQKSYPRLIPITFTDRLPELASAATLMVTKAGGVTLSECIAGGVPMVLLKPVPGHEEGNASYLVSCGAAAIGRGWHDIVSTVGRLLDSRLEREVLAENARKLYRPATHIITDAILEYINQRRRE